MNTTKRATKVAPHKRGRPPENRIRLSLTPQELAVIIEQLPIDGSPEESELRQQLGDSLSEEGWEARWLAARSLRHKLIAKGIDSGALRGDGSLS
jgi:hypothetical protein